MEAIVLLQLILTVIEVDTQGVSSKPGRHTRPCSYSSNGMDSGASAEMVENYGKETIMHSISVKRGCGSTV
jgi:hypothetical protein